MPKTSGLDVLVVDDGEAERFMARRSLPRFWPTDELGNLGELLLANSPDQAFDLLRQRQRGLERLVISSDGNMPMVEGPEMARRIRAMSGGLTVPISLFNGGGAEFIKAMIRGIVEAVSAQAKRAKQG